PSIEQVSGLPDEVKNFLSAEGFYLKATNFMAQGDMDNAAKQYEAALKIDAKYADAMADFGALKTLKGDWQGAADLYKKALAVNPKDALYHANYARVLAQLGDQEGCVAELEKSYLANPKDKVVLVALSDRIGKSDPLRSVQLLTDAVALFPNAPDLRERLCLAYIKSGDLTAAIEQGRKAVSLDANSASAKMNLGSALFISGDKQAAVESYRGATKLAPKNADAHFLLSKALEATGQAAGAKDELKAFLDLTGESDARVPQARQHLNELSEAR
ncbi:MAG TPA: tetratricopeptide repeat protein, partial [Chroococcales cyanobacterium]